VKKDPFFFNISDQIKNYKKNLFSKIKKNIDRTNFIMGQEVFDFEKKLSKKINSRYCVSVSNGTSALELSLIALGVGKGDDVITTSYSWISSASCILSVGAKPILIDINSNDFNINANLIEKKITKKTKAIIIVNLFGKVADFTKIKSVANRYKLKLIEDAAQSLGAKYNGKFSGTLADISCTSFFPTKTLGCFGDGGAIFTNNKVIFSKLKSLRLNGKDNNKFKFVGTNSRLDTLQATILLEKLKYFDHETLERRKIAKKYINELSRYCKTPILSNDYLNVYSVFTIIVKNRKKLISEFNKNQIPYAIYYKKSLHKEPIFKKFNFKDKDFYNSIQSSKNSISLPIYPGLKKSLQNKIISIIKSHY
jgi:UDP-2-acetamido-2-deoxy-ribo-hexuluronate aminotransferase